MIAMLSTMALIPPLIKRAPKWQFVDIPDQRKVHVNAIPRIGGVAMVIGALIPLFVWIPYTASNLSLLSGMLVIIVFGIWDDRKNLNYKIKFSGQILAAVIVVAIGDIRFRSLPLLNMELSPFIMGGITLFFILAITNAMNLVDGLDGLAGGTTLLSLGTVALLAWYNDQFIIVFVALAVMGSILGFLRFNTHPASVFMGDSGSQFLGFTLAILMVILTQNSGLAMSKTLPIVIAGLPILDTASVMFRRISEGRSPFSPDKNHIHHRLLKIGFQHYEVVIIIYIFQVILVLSAYLMRYYTDELIILFYFIFCASVLITLSLLERYGTSVSHSKVKSSYLIERRLFHTVKKYGVATVSILFFAYVNMVFMSIKEIGKDFILFLGIYFTMAFYLLVTKYKKPLGVTERALFYLMMSIVAYWSDSIFSVSALFRGAEMAIFISFLLFVLSAFVFDRNRMFSLTPLDLLVLVLVLVMANMPSITLPNGTSIGVITLKLVILFYVSEILLTKLGRNGDLCRGVLLLEFVALGVQVMRII